jgi:hypothetical protein
MAEGGSPDVPVTISQYYSSVTDGARKEIESTADDRVLGMDPSDWVDYLVSKSGMSPIVLDDSREDQMVESTREYTLRGYECRTDQGAGTRRSETAISVQVPVVPSDTIEAIWSHKLAPDTFSIRKSSV